MNIRQSRLIEALLIKSYEIDNLASSFNVSTKTIRNDIQSINQTTNYNIFVDFNNVFLSLESSLDEDYEYIDYDNLLYCLYYGYNFSVQQLVKHFNFSEPKIYSDLKKVNSLIDIDRNFNILEPLYNLDNQNLYKLFRVYTNQSLNFKQNRHELSKEIYNNLSNKFKITKSFEQLYLPFKHFDYTTHFNFQNEVDLFKDKIYSMLNETLFIDLNDKYKKYLNDYLVNNYHYFKFSLYDLHNSIVIKDTDYYNNELLRKLIKNICRDLKLNNHDIIIDPILEILNKGLFENDILILSSNYNLYTTLNQQINNCFKDINITYSSNFNYDFTHYDLVLSDKFIEQQNVYTVKGALTSIDINRLANKLQLKRFISKGDVKYDNMYFNNHILQTTIVEKEKELHEVDFKIKRTFRVQKESNIENVNLTLIDSPELFKLVYFKEKNIFNLYVSDRFIKSYDYIYLLNKLTCLINQDLNLLEYLMK